MESADATSDWVDTIGVVHTATRPFKEAKVSVFYLSSYSTDYVLLPESTWADALRVAAITHRVVNPEEEPGTPPPASCPMPATESQV